MTFSFDGSQYVIRLSKGEALMDSLLELIRRQNIPGGSISGLGGLVWAELGFYDLTAKTYVWSRFDEPLELLSLNGNISWFDDKPFVHAHAAVSDASQYAHGGHLSEAQVHGTVELFINVWQGKGRINRLPPDEDTGLKLLDIHEEV